MNLHWSSPKIITVFYTIHESRNALQISSVYKHFVKCKVRIKQCVPKFEFGMTISAGNVFFNMKPFPPYTGECCYSAAQHNRILHMVWQWWKQNMHWRLYSQKTPISCPYGLAMGCLLWMFGCKIGRVIMAPHCIYKFCSKGSDQ